MRSGNIEQDLLQIDANLWFFYNNENARNCEIHSIDNDIVEPILINEASILSLSCNKTLLCKHSQTIVSSCNKHQKISITPSSQSFIRTQTRFVLPINNMRRFILLSYESQLKNSTNEIFEALLLKRNKIESFFNDVFIYITSIISFILLIVCLLFIKLIQRKLKKEINSIESILEDVVQA